MILILNVCIYIHIDMICMSNIYIYIYIYIHHVTSARDAEKLLELPRPLRRSRPPPESQGAPRSWRADSQVFDKWLYTLSPSKGGWSWGSCKGVWG